MNFIFENREKIKRLREKLVLKKLEHDALKEELESIIKELGQKTNIQI